MILPGSPTVIRQDSGRTVKTCGKQKVGLHGSVFVPLSHICFPPNLGIPALVSQKNLVFFGGGKKDIGPPILSFNPLPISVSFRKKLLAAESGFGQKEPPILTPGEGRRGAKESGKQKGIAKKS